MCITITIANSIVAINTLIAKVVQLVANGVGSRVRGEERPIYHSLS
jgi:hypothetical protein